MPRPARPGGSDRGGRARPGTAAGPRRRGATTLITGRLRRADDADARAVARAVSAPAWSRRPPWQGPQLGPYRRSGGQRGRAGPGPGARRAPPAAAAVRAGDRRGFIAQCSGSRSPATSLSTARRAVWWASQGRRPGGHDGQEVVIRLDLGQGTGAGEGFAVPGPRATWWRTGSTRRERDRRRQVAGPRSRTSRRCWPRSRRSPDASYRPCSRRRQAHLGVAGATWRPEQLREAGCA